MLLMDHLGMTPLGLCQMKMHCGSRLRETKYRTIEDGNSRIGVLTISIVDEDIASFGGSCCCAPLSKECTKHHEQKRDPGVTHGTCGVVGERAQVIIVWVRAQGVRNTSYPRRLEVLEIRP